LGGSFQEIIRPNTCSLHWGKLNNKSRKRRKSN